tara:strand:+ start:76 stop:279 length:204 start_codon:yes stop_codon:yes gene_type:complete
MKKEADNKKETTPFGITRKDAIKKMGKYAAFSAVGTFVILNPKVAQAQSADVGNSGDNPPDPDGWGD